MTSPPIRVNRGLFTSRKEKIPVMDTPKSMKIKENPKMKKTEEKIRGFFCLIVKTFLFSIKEKYTGIIGNTQGEKKLIRPAPKATKTEISNLKCLFYEIFNDLKRNSSYNFIYDLAILK